MLKFNKKDKTLKKINDTNLKNEDLLERSDLQKAIITSWNEFRNEIGFSSAILVGEEIIPELLQSNCNSKNIFRHVSDFLENPNKIKEQLKKIQNILNELKINGASSELASLSLNKFLK